MTCQQDLNEFQMRLFTRLLNDMKYLQRVTLHLQKEDVILSVCEYEYKNIISVIYIQYIE